MKNIKKLRNFGNPFPDNDEHFLSLIETMLQLEQGESESLEVKIFKDEFRDGLYLPHHKADPWCVVSHDLTTTVDRLCNLDAMDKWEPYSVRVRKRNGIGYFIDIHVKEKKEN